MAKDIHTTTDTDLQKLVADKREELRVLRFQSAGSGMRDVKAFKAARKEIAMALTELNARAHGKTQS